MFERLSSEPIYNTRAVVQRIGVPADTFRAWERRYHVPAPIRDSNNHRLYSELDVAVIGWLRDQTRTGVTISQAIAILRSQSGKRARFLFTEHSIGDVNPADNATREFPDSPFAELRRRLVNALNTFDGSLAEHIVRESLAICSIENVCLELLYGAFLEIVDESQNGLTPVPCDHFAGSFIQRNLGALFNQSIPDEGRGPILAACPDGEPHEIDLLVTSIFLSHRGYKIVYLGGNVPNDELIHTIATTRPSLVLLAANKAEGALAIEQSIRSLSSAIPELPQITFGGHVFVRRPELRNGIDAIFIGRDAREAVMNVDLILASVTT